MITQRMRRCIKPAMNPTRPDLCSLPSMLCEQEEEEDEWEKEEDSAPSVDSTKADNAVLEADHDDDDEPDESAVEDGDVVPL